MRQARPHLHASCLIYPPSSHGGVGWRCTVIPLPGKGNGGKEKLRNLTGVSFQLNGGAGI